MNKDLDISRRKFIANTTGTVLGLSTLFPKTAYATNLLSSSKDKILIAIQLVGGNDGLNTLVPYNSSYYYQARPNLAIKSNKVIPLNDQLGLHPNLVALNELYQSGKLAIVSGVGYPNQSPSHFLASEMWQKPFEALPKDDQHQFNSDIHYKLVKHESPKASITKSANDFSQSMKFISEMITAGSSTPLYQVGFGGFDTHANQLETHSFLLKQLSESLFAFQNELQNHKLDQNVIVLIFSEFGRSLHENESLGTDHGTVQPIFILGNSIQGGLYGSSQLDTHPIDFRNIYATLFDRWLNIESEKVLKGQFNHLELV